MEDFEENENIAFDDISRIHPWDAIVQDLISELGGKGTVFEELKNLSKTQIGPENFRNIHDAQQYFECISNNLEESDLISFLINVTEYMQLHISLGDIKVSNRLKDYKKKLEEVQKERQKQGVYSDKDFVGRKRDIEEIVDLLSERSPEFKGVSSCGQGGMGKTSLAREVCYRMKCSKTRWIPKKIELREASSLTDLLRATLSTLHQSCHNVDDEDLSQQLFGYLKSCDKKFVLLFDNIDDIMAKEKDAIITFFKDLLFFLNDIDNCMIRVIITSREKLLSEDELLSRVLKSIFPRTETRLHKMVKEYELRALTDSESLELFTKCTKGRTVPINEEDASVIVQLCGNCPLAIRTISDTLRYNLISAQDIITRIRGSPSTDTFGVTDCLHQSFSTLDRMYQFKLVQLTVFKTAGFTTEAAMFVLDIRETFSTKTELLYLKSRHLIEIEDLTLLADDDSDSEFRNRENVRYSIHPLVFKYLQGRKEHDSELFREPMKNAKIKFLIYYEKKINDIGREQFQNYLEAQKIIADHSSHIISFYNMLHEYGRKLVTQQSGGKISNTMLSNKRIGDLADILLDDQKKFKLLKKWISAAERDGDNLDAMFWKIEKASKFFDMDRNDHAKAVLDEVEPELFSSEENHREGALCFVQAMFYFLRGRCLVIESKTDEGIEALKSAKRLFKTKQTKRFYRDCLANCYNSIGSAYYNKSPEPDIESARKYHEKALEKASQMSTENMNCDIPTFLTNIGTCFFREGVKCLNFNKMDEADIKFKEAKKKFDDALRLDVEMKLDKSKSYVQKLTNRASLHLRMKNYEAALKDATTAFKLGKEILRPPHVQLTLTAHKTGEIQRIYAREEYKKDKKDHAFEMFECAAELYKEIASMIKDGGLPFDNEEYPRIKHNHFDILRQLQDGQKIKIYKKFYEDFENRKFAHISKKKRSIMETEKYYPNRDDLEMADDSSSSSSSDEADDDVSDTESSSSDDVSEKAKKKDTEKEKEKDRNKKRVEIPCRTKKDKHKPQTVHRITKEISTKRPTTMSNTRKRKRDDDEKSEDSVPKKKPLLDYCHIL